MLMLRDVAKSDLKGLKRLAAVLNSVNLPDNESVLAAQIDKSVESFSRRIQNPFEREYLFVLEDAAKQNLIGTSLIIAQHGTKDAPHIYFQVTLSENYSASIDRHFRHKVLSIGYNYDGPTEIGGLVVAPAARSGPDKPGKQLSYVRFLFMAMHRELFRDQVLAELLPPLLPDGRSLLWEACGKKFTGLDYKEADKLSRRNKEFIKELFPASDIYATLFPLRTQKTIGVVGPNTRGVQRMLERIGFRYSQHIDPFDGGPHYEANMADISLVQQFQTLRVAKTTLRSESLVAEFLIAVSRESGTQRFRAIRTHAHIDDREIVLPESTKTALKVKSGEPVSLVPFDSVA